MPMSLIIVDGNLKQFLSFFSLSKAARAIFLTQTLSAVDS